MKMVPDKNIFLQWRKDKKLALRTPLPSLAEACFASSGIE